MEGGTDMNATEQQLLQTCKERLASHYGSRFKGLILYGSMARGTADPESDVDLLVLLEEPFDHFAELEVLIDLLYDLQLDSNRYLSVRQPAFKISKLDVSNSTAMSKKKELRCEA